MIDPPEGRGSYTSGKSRARQLMAQAAASVVRIQTYCTIVDMEVEKDRVKEVEPSGWDEGSVLATLNHANTVLDASGAYVKFELAGAIKRITLPTLRTDGKVDKRTFFYMAKTLMASGFKRREVKVAFIKHFSDGLLMGRSAQSLCFVCLRRPLMADKTQELKTGQGVGFGPQALAHEFGHILGLDHVKEKDSLMYESIFYEADTRLRQSERMIIQSHAHVDTRVNYTAPPGETRLSH